MAGRACQNDFLADFDALVADKARWPSDQRADLVLIPIAERAPKGLHRFLPSASR